MDSRFGSKVEHLCPKGFDLIQRFSEDLDLKLEHPDQPPRRELEIGGEISNRCPPDIL